MAVSPPAASLMQVTHYVGNYLGIADGLAELVYDIVNPGGGNPVIRGGRTVGQSFGVNETDVLRTIGSQYDPAKPEDAPFVWEMLIGRLRERGLERDTNAILRVIKTILDGTNTGSVGTVSTFHDAQLVLLEEAFTWIGYGWMSLPDLVEIEEAFAAVGEVVRTILSFEFPDIRERIPLDDDGHWFLLIEGNYTVTLPSTSGELFEWRFHSEGGMTLKLRLDQVTLLDATTLTLWHEGDEERFARVPIDLLGSVEDISLKGVALSLHMDPSLGGDHKEDFGPNHLFREAYYFRGDGARNVWLDLSVSGANVELRTNRLIKIFALGYPGVLTVNALEGALARDITRGVNERNIDELVGQLPAEAQENIDGALSFLEAVMPNVQACSRAQVGVPPLSADSAQFAFENLTTKAMGRGLSIHNRETRTGSGGAGIPGARDPGDIESPDLPPRNYDWEDPIPGNRGRGDGDEIHPISSADRPIRELPPPRAGARPADPMRPLATREKAGEEAVRRLRKLRSGGQERAVAMTLLSTAGSTPAETAYLRWADVDLEQGTVRGKPASAAVIKALRDVRGISGADTHFVFEKDGRVPGRKGVVRATERTMRFLELAAEPMPISRRNGCTYQSYSPIALTKGSRSDPAWVGLSTNCHLAGQVYRLMREQGAFDSSGSLTVDGQDLAYEIAVGGLAIDFTGMLFPEETENVQAPGLKLTNASVTLKRASDDGEAVEYAGRILVPLIPVSHEPGCLPDAAVSSVILNLDCVESLTGGSIDDADLLRDLLYRHFVFLGLDRRREAGLAIDQVTVESGDEAILGTTDRDALLAAVVIDAYAQVREIPVLFDPYWFLGGSIQEYHAEEGWIVMYKRYPLAALF